MSNLNIQTEEGQTGGRYVAVVDGIEAEMTYSRASDKLVIIDHTGVPEALSGQGVAKALAQYAVDDARVRGHKIIPLCPFMAAEFRKHPEWGDVLQS